MLMMILRSTRSQILRLARFFIPCGQHGMKQDGEVCHGKSVYPLCKVRGRLTKDSGRLSKDRVLDPLSSASSDEASSSSTNSAILIFLLAFLLKRWRGVDVSNVLVRLAETDVFDGGFGVDAGVWVPCVGAYDIVVAVGSSCARGCV
ncbi:hypothetical protein V6N12_068561 [Hibiscus sabdariffa]|uniref:Uncharacterized protein n=1 Tax=Hibiscus sabdariffa TaxID=183260 RepID=A0ABR2FQF9_9ROSI